MYVTQLISVFVTYRLYKVKKYENVFSPLLMKCQMLSAVTEK